MDFTVDNLIGELRAIFETLPDPRTGKNHQFRFADIAMAAFSAFFMQCPSFLDHQRRFLEAPNRHACHTLFGVARIPTDNHIREKLDHIDCRLLYPAFDMALGKLVEYQALGDFTRLDDRILIALDGSQFHHSNKIRCPQCSTTYHGKSDTVSYHHSVLCATLVADGHNQVVPLRPEFITPQDGDKKQDCETKAAHRWIKHHLPHYRHLRPVILADDLLAHHPICHRIVEAGCDFLFTAKPSSHKTLYSFLDGLQLNSRVTRPRRQKGAGRETRTYRWCRWPLPIRDTADALQVYWLSMKIQYRGKTTYENSFITSIEPTADNIEALANAARARWKIENESFNILKNNGYHMEHNFGHGTDGLSNLLLTLNLIAFGFHTVCDRICTRWRQARDRISTRYRFFNTLSVLNEYNCYSGWHDLLDSIIHPRRPRAPP